MSLATAGTALRHIVNIREYQLVQEDINQYRILIEPLPGASLDQHRALRILREGLEEYELGQNLEIKLEIVERLTAEDGKKFKRVVNKVRPPNDKDGEAVARHGATPRSKR